MGGVLKKIGGAVLNIAKTVLKSPVLSFAASFIPVVGPFIGMAAKVYQGYEALKKGDILGIEVPVPSLEEQKRVVEILDKFDALVNDLSSGLPAEQAARRTQYEYYRNKLLTFEEAA